MSRFHFSVLLAAGLLAFVGVIVSWKREWPARQRWLNFGLLAVVSIVLLVFRGFQGESPEDILARILVKGVCTVANAVTNWQKCANFPESSKHYGSAPEIPAPPPTVPTPGAENPPSTSGSTTPVLQGLQSKFRVTTIPTQTQDCYNPGRSMIITADARGGIVDLCVVNRQTQQCGPSIKGRIREGKISENGDFSFSYEVIAQPGEPPHINVLRGNIKTGKNVLTAWEKNERTKCPEGTFTVMSITSDGGGGGGGD